MVYIFNCYILMIWSDLVSQPKLFTALQRIRRQETLARAFRDELLLGWPIVPLPTGVMIVRMDGVGRRCYSTGADRRIAPSTRRKSRQPVRYRWVTTLHVVWQTDLDSSERLPHCASGTIAVGAGVETPRTTEHVGTCFPRDEWS